MAQAASLTSGTVFGIALVMLLVIHYRGVKRDGAKKGKMSADQLAQRHHEREERITGWYHRVFLVYALLFLTYLIVFFFYVTLFAYAHVTEVTKVTT